MLGEQAPLRFSHRLPIDLVERDPLRFIAEFSERYRREGIPIFYNVFSHFSLALTLSSATLSVAFRVVERM